MKVELEKLHMAMSPLTKNIFVGTIQKEGVWRNKRDMTQHFLDCVIQRFVNTTETIESDDEAWEITVKKIK